MLSLAVNVTNFVNGKPLLAIFGTGVGYVPSPVQDAITGAEVYRTFVPSPPSYPTGTVVHYDFQIPADTPSVFSFGEFVLLDPSTSTVFAVGVLDLPQQRALGQSISVSVYFDVSQITPHAFGTTNSSTLAINIPYYGSLNALSPVKDARMNMAICQSPFDTDESILAMYTAKLNPFDFDAWSFSNYTLVGTGLIGLLLNANIAVLTGVIAADLTGPGQYILQTKNIVRVCSDLTNRVINGVTIPTVTLDNQALNVVSKGDSFKLYLYSGSSSVSQALVNSLTVTAAQLNAVGALDATKLIRADGSVKMEHDLNLNGFKVTNIGAAVDPTDAANLAKLIELAGLSTLTVQGLSNSIATLTSQLSSLKNRIAAIGG